MSLFFFCPNFLRLLKSWITDEDLQYAVETSPSISMWQSWHKRLKKPFKLITHFRRFPWYSLSLWSVVHNLIPVHCITPFCSDTLVSPPNLYPPWFRCSITRRTSYGTTYFFRSTFSHLLKVLINYSRLIVQWTGSWTISSFHLIVTFLLKKKQDAVGTYIWASMY